MIFFSLISLIRSRQQGFIFRVTKCGSSKTTLSLRNKWTPSFWGLITLQLLNINKKNRFKIQKATSYFLTCKKYCSFPVNTRSLNSQLKFSSAKSSSSSTTECPCKKIKSKESKKVWKSKKTKQKKASRFHSHELRLCIQQLLFISFNSPSCMPEQQKESNCSKHSHDFLNRVC